jgi:hypothetical protein
MRRESARRASHDDPPAAVAPIPTPPRSPNTTARVDDQNLETLNAEARYHRDRLALYRARVYAGKPTSATRLRELERTAAAAATRLAHAADVGDRRSTLANER